MNNFIHAFKSLLFPSNVFRVTLVAIKRLRPAGRQGYYVLRFKAITKFRLLCILNGQ